ncbi:hypothetical protein JTE90_009255 [Oedothorax gibbosus]|uniref:Uncharacterized protein n=1 Tax=Oedothorax gibbosus TaxID=931172 RepID=A0AAV6V258_9ARAC|nr:hypothetical protein JTE90_009255 [Oedothorax gibbosus]
MPFIANGFIIKNKSWKKESIRRQLQELFQSIRVDPSPLVWRRHPKNTKTTAVSGMGNEPDERQRKLTFNCPLFTLTLFAPEVSSYIFPHLSSEASHKYVKAFSKGQYRFLHFDSEANHKELRVSSEGLHIFFQTYLEDQYKFLQSSSLASHKFLLFSPERQQNFSKPI